MVDGKIVGVDCGDGVETISVNDGVSAGSEAAIVGGTSIPAKSIEVPLKPMKRPRPRYLMSARMMAGMLVVGGPIKGVGFDVKVDVIPFGFVADDMFVIIALPNGSAWRIQLFIYPPCGK